MARKKATAKRTKRLPAKKQNRSASAGNSDDLLTMAQAIEKLKTTRPTFYRWLRAGKIKGMKVGRQWRFRPEDIQRFMTGDEPRIELPTSASPLLETLEAKLKQVAGEPKAIPDEPIGDDPVLRAVALMIRTAYQMRASDLHLHPDGSTAVMRVRVDGIMHEVATFDSRLLPAIIDRWMIMGNCKRDEKRRPQDAVVMVSIEGKRIDLRLNFMPTIDGMAMTGRLFVTSDVLLKLDQLGMAADDRKRLEKAIHRPSGLIVMNGPTGCGKTTTVYACLSEINDSRMKIVTIEDPVEFRIKGLLQMQVDAEVGMTIEAAIRATLRADPDVLFVTEIRSATILQLCNQAALTGHLVFSQLHTQDSPSALLRMIDLGVAPLLLADSVKLVASQRLLRALCPHCRKPDRPSGDQLARLGALARDGGVSLEQLPDDWHQPTGCDHCAQTGYRGRVAAMETLEMSDPIAIALRGNPTGRELRSIAISQGMTTMGADAARRAASGQTSIAEALRVFGVTNP
jgi:excisionase family DNA binding protein